MSDLQFNPRISGSLQLADAQSIAIMVRYTSIHYSALAKLTDSRPRGVPYVAIEATDALTSRCRLMKPPKYVAQAANIVRR